MSWKAEVVADNSGRWIGNHMCFATKEEAEAYLRGLKFNASITAWSMAGRCQSRTQTKCPLWGAKRKSARECLRP